MSSRAGRAAGQAERSSKSISRSIGRPSGAAASLERPVSQSVVAPVGQRESISKRGGSKRGVRPSESLRRPLMRPAEHSSSKPEGPTRTIRAIAQVQVKEAGGGGGGGNFR